MIPLLLGLGLLVGGAVVVAYWDEVVKWLKEFVPKLKSTWARNRESVPYGVRIYGDIIVEGADRLAKIMHRLYYKEGEQWVEKTTTRKVDASQVPATIRNKFAQQEADITEEIEEELEMEI